MSTSPIIQKFNESYVPLASDQKIHDMSDHCESESCGNEVLKELSCNYDRNATKKDQTPLNHGVSNNIKPLPLEENSNKLPESLNSVSNDSIMIESNISTKQISDSVSNDSIMIESNISTKQISETSSKSLIDPKQWEASSSFPDNIFNLEVQNLEMIPKYPAKSKCETKFEIQDVSVGILPLENKETNTHELNETVNNSKSNDTNDNLSHISLGEKGILPSYLSKEKDLQLIEEKELLEDDRSSNSSIQFQGYHVNQLLSEKSKSTISVSHIKTDSKCKSTQDKIKDTTELPNQCAPEVKANGKMSLAEDGVNCGPLCASENICDIIDSLPSEKSPLNDKNKSNFSDKEQVLHVEDKTVSVNKENEIVNSTFTNILTKKYDSLESDLTQDKITHNSNTKSLDLVCQEPESIILQTEDCNELSHNIKFIDTLLHTGSEEKKTELETKSSICSETCDDISEVGCTQTTTISDESSNLFQNINEPGFILHQIENELQMTSELQENSDNNFNKPQNTCFGVNSIPPLVNACNISEEKVQICEIMLEKSENNNLEKEAANGYSGIHKTENKQNQLCKSESDSCNLNNSDKYHESDMNKIKCTKQNRICNKDSEFHRSNNNGSDTNKTETKIVNLDSTESEDSGKNDNDFEMKESENEYSKVSLTEEESYNKNKYENKYFKLNKLENRPTELCNTENTLKSRHSENSQFESEKTEDEYSEMKKGNNDYSDIDKAKNCNSKISMPQNNYCEANIIENAASKYERTTSDKFETVIENEYKIHKDVEECLKTNIPKNEMYLINLSENEISEAKNSETEQSVTVNRNETSQSSNTEAEKLQSVENKISKKSSCESNHSEISVMRSELVEENKANNVYSEINKRQNSEVLITQRETIKFNEKKTEDSGPRKDEINCFEIAKTENNSSGCVTGSNDSEEDSIEDDYFDSKKGKSELYDLKKDGSSIKIKNEYSEVTKSKNDCSTTDVIKNSNISEICENDNNDNIAIDKSLKEREGVIGSFRMENKIKNIEPDVQDKELTGPRSLNNYSEDCINLKRLRSCSNRKIHKKISVSLPKEKYNMCMNMKEICPKSKNSGCEDKNVPSTRNFNNFSMPSILNMSPIKCNTDNVTKTRSPSTSEVAQSSPKSKSNEKKLRPQRNAFEGFLWSNEYSEISDKLRSSQLMSSSTAQKFGLKKCKVSLERLGVGRSLLTNSRELTKSTPNFCKLKRKLEDMIKTTQAEEEKTVSQIKRMRKAKTNMMKDIIREIENIQEKYNISDFSYRI